MIYQLPPEFMPRVEAALNELQQMIAARFPQATFVIEEGDDPVGTYLVATVDVPDTDEVFAVVVDRLIDVQVEEGLPVYVVVVRPIERVLEYMREQERAHGRSPLPTG
jgi:hypothetical protein